MGNTILDYLSGFANKYENANTAPQVELLRFLKKLIPSATKIGILPVEIKSKHFGKSITQVIFIIREGKGGLFSQPTGCCICVTLNEKGTISCELHPDFSSFRPFWYIEEISLFNLLKINNELNYFLRNQKPMDKKIYRFLNRDNIRLRLVEEIRDLEIQKEIEETFGFKF